MSSPPEDPLAAPPPARLLNKRLAVVIALVVLGVVLLQFTPLQALRENIQNAKALLGDLGWKGWGIYLGLASIGIALGISRLFFCFLGGLAFGFQTGIGLALLSGLLGASLAFGLLRWWGGNWVQQLSGRAGRLRDKLHDPDTLTVAVIRQIPISGIVINAVLAFSVTRWLPFLAGTLLGYLPQTLIFTLLGSGLAKDSPTLAVIQILSSVVLILLFGWVAGRWILRLRAKVS